MDKLKEWLGKAAQWTTDTEPGRISLAVVVTVIVAIAVCLLGCNDARAASLSLTCTPPTTRTDATPLPTDEIAGYWWYRDGIKINTELTPACAITVILPDGTYEITAQTVDTEGRESVMSAGKQKTWVTAAPSPPTIQ